MKPDASHIRRKLRRSQNKFAAQYMRFSTGARVVFARLMLCFALPVSARGHGSYSHYSRSHHSRRSTSRVKFLGVNAAVRFVPTSAGSEKFLAVGGRARTIYVGPENPANAS